nr:probable WRKY transcription factor protein 1 [Megalopta genalis]
MLNFRDKYKSKRFGFANVDVSRAIRADKDENRRKTERTKVFNKNRNIPNTTMNVSVKEETAVPPAVESRSVRLRKWIQERDRKRKLEQAKKKRPFVVGIVHHKVYSPITKDEQLISTTNSKKVYKSNIPMMPLVQKKKITKVTEKRLMHRAQLHRIIKNSVTNSKSVKNEQPEIPKEQEQSFASANYKFKPPEGLRKIPLFGRVTNSINGVLNESLFFPKASIANQRSGNTNFSVEPISNTTLNTSYTIEKKQDDTTEEEATEPFVLKLSSDDEEVFNTVNRYNTRSKKNSYNNGNNVSEKNEKLNDLKRGENLSDSKKKEKHEDSKKNEKLDDSKKNEKLNKKNEKMNDSKKNEKLNDSKKNEKVNDSKRNNKGSEELHDTKNEKLNDSKKNKKMNNRLCDGNSDNESNEKYEDDVARGNKVINNSIKDTYDTINNSSKETHLSSNNGTPKSAQDSSNEPIFLSPYVVSSRGKSNARKEQQMKRGFSLHHTPSDYIPTKESVMENLNISIEGEERTAQYFEFLLNREIDRQNELCDKWTKIKDEPGITEDAKSQINQAIGQTNLLMNKKFARFRNLVTDCATGKGEMLVTSNDLQGFWDLMHIEVENCNLRFEKLEQLRLRGWEEEQVIAADKSRTKKKVAVRTKTVQRSNTRSNGIKEFLAKRKQNIVEETQNNNDIGNLGILNNKRLSNKYKSNENSPNLKHKSGTPDKTKLSLLRKVQLSETRKRSSPLTVMKISQMCKTPEIQLDDSISYINSHQTRAKSILKQSKYSNQVDIMKPAHKVNFDEKAILNKEVVDNDTQTRRDLAAALARIDNLDFYYVNDETPIHAERKLAFDDDSFEEGLNLYDSNRHSELEKSKNKNMETKATTTLQKSMLNSSPNTLLQRGMLTRQNGHENDEIPSLSIIASTPFKEIVDSTDLNECKQKLQSTISTNKEEKTTEYSDNIRVLRNRSIISENTPIQKRRYSKKLSMNVHESGYKENKTPTKSKSSLKINSKDDTLINTEVDLYDAIRGMSLNEISGTRKSSRRSVKFSERDCTGCVEKPTLPMTPHVRRSRAQSTEKKTRSMITQVPIETLEKPPERVRRSRSRKA